MIKHFIANLKRAIEFFKIGWSNYDWDFHHLENLMLFKLKRIQKDMQNCTFIEYEKKDLQSIRIAVKLLTRIVSEDYSESVVSNLEFISIKNENKWFCTIEDICKNKEDQDLLHQKRREQYELNEKIKQRDIRNFYAIIAKYRNRWWT